MDMASKKLVISNLHYQYNLCVDPKSVSFGVHSTNNLGFCKTDTSISAVVVPSWVEKAAADSKQTADLTLKIDANHLNAQKLGNVYSESNDKSKIDLCVRARVVQEGIEILSTETNFQVTYSMTAQFSVSAVNVNRQDNGKVAEDIGAISRSNKAYQCNAKYEEVTSPAPLSPHSNVLRVCIEGESDAFQCEKIVSATLKQAGKTDNTLITKGTSIGKYTEQSSKSQICMLTTLVLPKYFVKKSADDKLSLTLEGSALMPLASQRRRLAAKAPGDKNFELTVEVLSAGEPYRPLRSEGTVSGARNVVVSAIVAILMLT